MVIPSKGIFIVGAKRTPFCKYGGSLRETPACHVFAAAARDAIQSANIDPEAIDHTFVGNVHFLSQRDGGKTPRYCGIYSGVPIEKPALGINKSCGSGLQAVINGALEILTGLAKVTLTGGTEQLTTQPHLVRNVRFGTLLGSSYQFEDHVTTQFVDSLAGLTLKKAAEELAKKYQVTREDADKYALESHLKWKINDIFASQAILTSRQLNLDPGKVNVDGGAVTVGHPVAATAARMAVHLVHEMRRRNLKKGIVASSCGGGQGIAVLLESM